MVQEEQIKDFIFEVTLIDSVYRVSAPTRSEAVTKAIKEFETLNPRSTIPKTLLRARVKTHQVDLDKEEVNNLLEEHFRSKKIKVDETFS